jgi:hypothetical protein
MLSWLVDGTYTIGKALLPSRKFSITDFFPPHADFETALHNPHLTILDMHIHAFIAADKYNMPNLADHAVQQYIDRAAYILSQSLPADLPNVSSSGAYPTTFANHRHISLPQEKNDRSISAEVNRFLDSVVLLWKHTNDGHAFRNVVLEVVKPCLHKLARLRMFGCMLAELNGFAKGLRESLMEDGVWVDAYPRLKGNEAMLVFVNDRPVQVVDEDEDDDEDDDEEVDEEVDEEDDEEDDDYYDQGIPQRICGVSVSRGLYED